MGLGRVTERKTEGTRPHGGQKERQRAKESGEEKRRELTFTSDDFVP